MHVKEKFHSRGFTPYALRSKIIWCWSKICDSGTYCMGLERLNMFSLCEYPESSVTSTVPLQYIKYNYLKRYVENCRMAFLWPLKLCRLLCHTSLLEITEGAIS